MGLPPPAPRKIQWCHRSKRLYLLQSTKNTRNRLDIYAVYIGINAHTVYNTLLDVTVRTKCRMPGRKVMIMPIKQSRIKQVNSEKKESR